MKFQITPHPFADWFFPDVSVRLLRLFQIALGFITLCQVVIWMPHVHAFFTNEGFVTADYVYQTTTYSHLSILFLFDAPWFVYTCFATLILSCLGVIFGIGGRLSAILMYFFFISFASRFPLIFYGAIDAIHSVLFFNMLHPSEAYEGWKEGGATKRAQKVPAWSIRMIQLTLAIIYFAAACQKIRVNTWWNGTEILNSLSTRFGAYDYSWLRNYPLIVNLMTYGSWLLEGSFAFLIWNKTTHRFMFISMMGLHAGIAVLMNASLFSQVMMVALIVFINPEDESRVAELWNNYTKQLRAGWQRSRLLKRSKA